MQIPYLLGERTHVHIPVLVLRFFSGLNLCRSMCAATASVGLYVQLVLLCLEDPVCLESSITSGVFLSPLMESSVSPEEREGVGVSSLFLGLSQ